MNASFLELSKCVLKYSTFPSLSSPSSNCTCWESRLQIGHRLPKESNRTLLQHRLRLLERTARRTRRKRNVVSPVGSVLAAARWWMHPNQAFVAWSAALRRTVRPAMIFCTSQTEIMTTSERAMRIDNRLSNADDDVFDGEGQHMLTSMKLGAQTTTATIHHRRNATMTAINYVILSVDERPVPTPPSVPRSFPAAAASIPNFSTTPRSSSVSTVALPKGRGSKPPKRVVGSIIVPVRVDWGSIGTLTHRRTSPSSQRRMSSFYIVSQSFDSHLHSIITPTAINNDPNNNNVSSVGAPLKGLPMSSSASSNLQMF